MRSFFDKIAALTLQEVVAILGLAVAGISLSFKLGTAWARRTQSRADRSPKAKVMCDGALHLYEWRHATFQIENRRDTDIRLFAVRRLRPWRMRLFRFIDHHTAPTSGPLKQLDADTLFRANGAPGRGYELLFKLPDTPQLDAGTEISLTLFFRDTDEGKVITKKVKCRIASP